MPAPTLAQPAQAQTAPNGTAAASGQAVPALIPFTRAARKKQRQVAQFQIALGAAAQQLPPVQVPANGFIKKLTLEITGTTSANAATVAFANDAPFSAVQSASMQAANGDSLINPLSGFTLAMLQKYGAFGRDSGDPLSDPTYSVVTGVGAGLGGSFHFQVDVPFEVDPRDALCALPNMAANQSFLLQLFVAATGSIYSTPPTTPPVVTVIVTAEYWAAPDAANQQGIAQQTSPRVGNAVSLIQTQTPAITPGQDQVVPLTNVGNTIRFLYFELRTAAGVRTDADWPGVFQLLVNNDLWDYKTKANFKRLMAQNYGYFAGVTNAPTLNALDTGVYMYTEFMNDGAQGSNTVSSSANRDLMLVTGSGTALSAQFTNWGASASQLNIVTNALRIPDPTSFYAPFGI